MLIRQTALGFDAPAVDVRIAGGRIVHIAPSAEPEAGEPCIDAQGGALLPGLWDHHLHLGALAAARNSVACGPPAVRDAAGLAAALQQAAITLGAGEWLRGTGYHESVAGDIDRRWLDRALPAHPARIQHRSGRLWILNSAALARLGALGADAPLERGPDGLTGRLFDADGWLRSRLAARRPSLSAVSRALASRGVTGLTEVTARNDRGDFDWLVAAREHGELLQDVLVMGDQSLDAAAPRAGVRRGATKIHLHENELPPLQSLRRTIERSHDAGRPVALHCAALGELAVALQGLAEAGARAGDRIEHASVTPDSLLGDIRALGVCVVTQPNFVFERGDEYRRDLPSEQWDWLYRARSFRDAQIPLAAGTDAPFGTPDPWLAMQAAVERRTRRGALLGEREALSPEDAFGLFAGSPDAPGAAPEALRPGAVANLCLIDRPWREARSGLGAVRVIATLRAGKILHSQSATACQEENA